MNENGAETPEQVVKFAPKSGPRTDGFEVEEVGQAIVAKLQKAAELSNENCDRAMALAHKLAMELIPNPIDQNPWAHWRSPMDMMRQG